MALVATCISSSLFLKESIPARWVLGGFVVSHVFVFGLGWADVFKMRRGHVGLFHLLCWSPGWITTCLEAAAKTTDSTNDMSQYYMIWSRLVMVIIGVSFLFDFRDFVSLVSCTWSGRLNAVESSKTSNKST